MRAMTMTRFFISVAVLGAFALIVSVPADAQIVKKAQVGFRFLENPVGADVIGKGSVGAATEMNSTGMFWNPALIGWLQPTLDISLHRTTFIADINYNAAAAAVRLWDFGVLGVNLIMMDYGTFYGTRRAANSEGFIETGEFSPAAFAFGVTFAQKVSDRFSYGVQVKYVDQDLGNSWVATAGRTLTDTLLQIEERKYQKSEYTVDVGALYDFRYKGIKFGAALRNVSEEFRYENDKFPMPFSVSFAVTIEPLQFMMEQDENQNLVVSFESQHPRDFKEKLKFGGEYTFMRQFIARMGYMLNYDERGFTAGLGIRQQFEGFGFRADYGYMPFGIFGSVHHISVGFSY